MVTILLSHLLVSRSYSVYDRSDYNQFIYKFIDKKLSLKKIYFLKILLNRFYL